MILLVSDLDDDPGDLPSLAAAALALTSEHVAVRVVGPEPGARATSSSSSACSTGRRRSPTRHCRASGR